MPTTLYWHDYETFGTDPRRDRPAQFAGLRTDEALNEIGKPLVIYCKPARDFLPHPEACLLTGITPQIADAQGLPEPEFIGRFMLNWRIRIPAALATTRYALTMKSPAIPYTAISMTPMVANGSKGIHAGISSTWCA